MTLEYHAKKPVAKKKESLKMLTEKTIKQLMITLVAMFVVLSVVYVSINSENSQNGYTMSQIQMENDKLLTENQKITSKITKSTSIQEVLESEKIQTMIEPQTKIFVDQDDNKI